VTIEDLQLNGNANAVATALQLRCPAVVFTSGRRGIDEQAHDDAANIISAGDSKWMTKVYVASSVLSACQAAVDALTTPLDVQAVETAIQGALAQFGDEDLEKFSAHLGGNAFDVKPGSCDLPTLSSLVSAASGRLLTEEDGLVRWHAQIP
jgi:hypothetical protein